MIAPDRYPRANAFVPTNKTLSEEHRKMLTEESNISLEYVAARGYWTATSRAQLDGLKDYQRRVPALVVPTHSPDGISTGLQIRPDQPRKRGGKAIKYETPAGTQCILDVNPLMLSRVRDPSTPLWVTEGVKKGDALASRGECAISIVGVWNWQRKGELLPCWQHVALDGREVFVVFDSDVMVKPEVQLALERLAASLEERGARVNVVYLPEVAHG